MFCSSGIGRATGILFAMEGAEAVFFTYLPAEKKDAEDTKAKIEKAGAKVRLLKTTSFYHY